LLCLSEHWLLESQLKQINITNYTLVNSFCRLNSKHGGVGVFSKNSLNIKLEPLWDLNKFAIEGIKEITGASIHLNNDTKNSKVNLIVLYRPPSSDLKIFQKEFEAILDKILKLKSDIKVLGDFNIDISKQTQSKIKLTSLLERINLNLTVTTRSATRCVVDTVLSDSELKRLVIGLRSWVVLLPCGFQV
jgi:exonuclease III